MSTSTSPVGRPPVLFPLFAGLDTLDGIGPKTASHFAQMQVTRPRDLLFTLPSGGADRRRRDTVRGLTPPVVATVEVEVLRHMPAASRGRPWRVEVEDAETRFQLVFFHARGDYLEKLLPVGARRLVSGRLETFDNILQMPHPDHVRSPEDGAAIPDFEPLYPLTAGITQKLMSRAAASALARVSDMAEWIDPGLMAQKGWPAWDAALRMAHAPRHASDLMPEAGARQRLAYDELFAHQLTLALARAERRRVSGIETRGDGGLRDRVLAALPFAPTGAQTRAMAEIAADMGAPARMNRLLQGDVGAGKTLVALMALLVAVEAGGQGVLMAPTEILARQHHASIAPLAQAAGVRAEILTGRDKGAERAAKLAALAKGEIGILIGTHAVFQKDVQFDDLRLAVIDEQHRFGVAQRMQLGAKGARADVLVMTATPIPRSLSLAQYGDMDLSILDEKPPGRTPVTTSLVSSPRIPDVVERLREAVAAGRQAYWVCPLVEESENLDMTAAEDRFKQLRAALGDGLVGLVHGQMPGPERDAAMGAFARGETGVLVATTVIEVGVDVPNASIMVIERAESFGLAQLHQLRGRVGRGATASTCLLLYQPPLTETGQRRLEILRETEDGFRIAEEDLLMRGAGDMIGTAQSGLPRFRIADLERQAGLMKLAQSDARKLLADDPKLTSPRGQAARVLLWLMEQDQAIRLIRVG
ncbi:ATP-dependent DNA helicase RecG [Pacificitalea manganoxidans]|uniref:ATP-dependent DNA helicase RecG n=1 Tax=Pacificitalea manganoxidans TaxID=1411902 RepID=A0A291LYW8_9RHOB|nr:ATP-dependent DNA helicase RecG [Pacificitalea manganoxidans]ATI41889.1 ATP-dependent DNA helicase RecG [Pacificitalea manganoxidans]MDR6309371.1 ATP-dependent DNA helicase RecG [Pacificitalea manganoxidans]